MSQLESQTSNAKPFRLVLELMVADEQGDYRRAIATQNQLQAMGWYVARRPPEQDRTRNRPGTAPTPTS